MKPGFFRLFGNVSQPVYQHHQFIKDKSHNGPVFFYINYIEKYEKIIMLFYRFFIVLRIVVTQVPYNAVLPNGYTKKAILSEQVVG